MQASASFSKTQPKKKLQICGTCRRVRFNLSMEEQALLNKLISWHGAELMRCWLKKDVIKVPGGHRVDSTKTRAVKIINENPAICSCEGIQVFWPDMACALWLPNIF